MNILEAFNKMYVDGEKIRYYTWDIEHFWYYDKIQACIMNNNGDPIPMESVLRFILTGAKRHWKISNIKSEILLGHALYRTCDGLYYVPTRVF